MKPTQPRAFLILAAIVISALGCNLSTTSIDSPPENNQRDYEPAVTAVPIITDTPTIEPTSPPIIVETNIPLPQPTSTTAPTPTIQNHYYFNNYDSEAQVMLPKTEEGVSRGFQNGQFVVQIESGPLTYHLILIDEDLTDAHVSGQVDFIGQPGDAVGLFCRKTQEPDGTSALYVFLVDRQGNYLVAFRQLDSRGFTTLENTITAGSTNLLNPPGGQLNRLNAVCLGDELYFFINGELAAEATSRQIQGAGKFGLITSSADGSEDLTAYWDLVALTKP